VKKIAFYACFCISSAYLFGSFDEEVPQLSPDMNAQQLSSTLRFLEKVFYNTPNDHRIHAARIVSERLIPDAFDHSMRLFNRLNDTLDQDLIDRDELLWILNLLSQDDRQKNRIQTYGDDDSGLLNILKTLEDDDGHNTPLEQNDFKVLFLKSFLETGRHYIKDVYVKKLAKAAENTEKVRSRYDSLSNHERAAAEEIIDVYGTLLNSLKEFKSLDGDALTESLSNFMHQQSYRDIKERYDAIQERFAQGELIVLSEVLDDVLNDTGVED
jgi:hypothetical protein